MRSNSGAAAGTAAAAAAGRAPPDAGAADLIQMKVEDVDRVKEYGQSVVAAVGEDYTVQDWQDLNAPIYTALTYEKFLSGIALLIVIGIAALNIITVLIMIVIDKQRDIAILGSDHPQYVAPSQLRGAVHDFALVYLGVHLFDNCDLEALGEAAAARNRWEFLLTAAPLPIRGGTGSPANPIGTF